MLAWEDFQRDFFFKRALSIALYAGVDCFCFVPWADFSASESLSGDHDPVIVPFCGGFSLQLCPFLLSHIDEALLQIDFLDHLSVDYFFK